MRLKLTTETRNALFRLDTRVKKSLNPRNCLLRRLHWRDPRVVAELRREGVE